MSPNVTQTRQTVRTTVSPDAATGSSKKVVEKRRGIMQTILDILRADGPAAFFHGLGPALILVSNPILQFTVRIPRLWSWSMAARSRRYVPLAAL